MLGLVARASSAVAVRWGTQSAAQLKAVAIVVIYRAFSDEEMILKTCLLFCHLTKG